MPDDLQNPSTAFLVNWNDVERFDVLGPVVQFPTPLPREEEAPCVMRGTVGPGVIIPLHSHGDPETFVQVAGELEGLCESGGEFIWVPIRAGEVFHVPGGARHAFRNRSSEPAISMILTTRRLAGFLKSIGVRVGKANVPPPSPERIADFLTKAGRLGYWNATPEENARVGLDLFPAAPPLRMARPRG
jgi:quercetin dioxygenase-like cupin family protein